LAHLHRINSLKLVARTTDREPFIV
jgi:hypothetical protein